MIGHFIHNTSELLALLCIAGIVGCAFRWRTAARRDFLFAFALFLAGTFLREYVVWIYGVANWPLSALMWSGAGRAIQILGGVLFVRASLREVCGEWGWMLVFVASAIGAGLL